MSTKRVLVVLLLLIVLFDLRRCIDYEAIILSILSLKRILFWNITHRETSIACLCLLIAAIVILIKVHVLV